jgi:hypothetical protein
LSPFAEVVGGVDQSGIDGDVCGHDFAGSARVDLQGGAVVEKHAARAD